MPGRRLCPYTLRMETAPHILVVDDDREIRDLLGRCRRGTTSS